VTWLASKPIVEDSLDIAQSLAKQWTRDNRNDPRLPQLSQIVKHLSDLLHTPPDQMVLEWHEYHRGLFGRREAAANGGTSQTRGRPDRKMASSTKAAKIIRAERQHENGGWSRHIAFLR
jgi:hypothetical protein